MNSKKIPLELLEHLKKKETQREDGTEMSDKEKHRVALDKAHKYQKQKRISKEK